MSLRAAAATIVLTALCGLFSAISAPPAAPGLPASTDTDQIPPSISQWFAANGPDLYDTLAQLAPTKPSTTPQAGGRHQPQWTISPIAQVSTWNPQMLRSAQYRPEPLQKVPWWVVGVAVDGHPLGIVLHYNNTKRPLPKGITVPSPSPSATTTQNEPPTGPLQLDSEGQVREPKNSTVPLKTVANGQVFVVPKLAQALLDSAANLGSVRPVWDEAIGGWFALHGLTLVPASTNAFAQMAGPSRLPDLAWAIASWWGAVAPSPTAEEEPSGATPVSDLLVVLLAAVLIVTIFGALLVVPLRRFGHWADDTDPLPDPELNIVYIPGPPPTATPTSTTSLAVVKPEN